MGAFFAWEPLKDSLEIDEMDRQHKQLVWLMEELASKDSAGASKRELRDLLHQLLESTVVHFREEEAYMAATGYPKLDTHQLIHRDLLASLREHVATFETGTGRLGTKLISFLKYWLSAHIKGIDRQYGRHARRLAGPMTPES